MTDLIRVPYTELFERAFRIRQQAEAVRIELQTLNETVESLQWVGNRADRFFLMWEDSKRDMENWVRTLEMFANDLENQARRIQMVDEGF